MPEKNHRIKIPCMAAPFVCEADRCAAGEHEIHINRIFGCNVVILLLKGSMEIIEDGVRYALTAGDIFFLKSGVHHWGEKPFERGTVWYYAHFLCPEPEVDMRSHKPPQVTDMERVYLQTADTRQFFELPKLLKRRDYSDFEHIEQLFRRLAAAHNSGDTLQASALLLNIFSDIIGRGRKKSSNIYADRIKAYIEEHYAEEITSADIEKLCGISYKHICTVFREHTGITVKKYLIGERMKAACRLLEETSLTVSEIAEKVGMGDVYYFSRIFSREKGCPPMQYRKAYVPRI